MQARATFGGPQIAGSVLRTFIIAVFVALLVGGAGGYIARALTSAASASPATDIQRPFVVEQAPYSSATSQPQCVLTGTPPNLAC